MNALNLDQKEVLAAMFEDFPEAGLDDSGECNSNALMTSDALKKQIRRYLLEERTPSIETIGTWAKGLHWRAIEIQDRSEDTDHYVGFVKDIYGGVLVMNKLFLEGEKLIRHEDLLHIMNSYQSRFDRHMSTLKKEASIKPASP